MLLCLSMPIVQENYGQKLLKLELKPYYHKAVLGIMKRII